MIKIYLSDCSKDTEHRVGISLAKYALEDAFGMKDTVSYNGNGKPFFAKAPAYVSISHSSGLCLAAVSDTEIGADIEFMQKDNTRLVKLAKRFFTPDEALYVETAPEERFFEIWCAKESYVKYTGEGFSHPFSSFSIKESGLLFSHFRYGSHMIAVCSAETAADDPIFIPSHSLRSE